MVATSPRLLAPDPPHYAWDNSLSPKLLVQSGETVTFQTPDAAPAGCLWLDGHPARFRAAAGRFSPPLSPHLEPD
jgi:hypothetical protein